MRVSIESLCALPGRGFIVMVDDRLRPITALTGQQIAWSNHFEAIPLSLARIPISLPAAGRRWTEPLDLIFAPSDAGDNPSWHLSLTSEPAWSWPWLARVVDQANQEILFGLLSGGGALPGSNGAPLRVRIRRLSRGLAHRLIMAYPLLLVRTPSSLANARMSGNDLAAANPGEIAIRRSHFRRANLFDANLGSALVTISNFNNATLALADLSGMFKNCSFSGANMDEAAMSGASLSNCFIERASLAFAKAPGARFFNCRMAGSDLTGADLHSAYFYRCDLSHTVFRLADLNAATFIYCNFNAADLRGANIAGANISYCEGGDAQPPEFADLISQKSGSDYSVAASYAASLLNDRLRSLRPTPVSNARSFVVDLSLPREGDQN